MMRMNYFQQNDTSTGLIGHSQAHSGHLENRILCVLLCFSQLCWIMQLRVHLELFAIFLPLVFEKAPPIALF